MKIMSIDDTIDELINRTCSIARFGEGEYKWVRNIDNPSFQAYSKNMADDLKRVLKCNDPRVMIALCDCFGDLSCYEKDARVFWTGFAAKYRLDFYKLIDKKHTFYNAMITRLYIDLKEKPMAPQRFIKLMSIWNGRNVLIIEGEKTRIGVGNDFLDSAKTVRRILCPATNAYAKYSDIISATKKHYQKDDVILVALGPTATILAVDLTIELDAQVIDIGHADIEYEWYLRGADKKEFIPNKFTNEVGYFGGDNNMEMYPVYLRQIVERVL